MRQNGMSKSAASLSRVDCSLARVVELSLALTSASMISSSTGFASGGSDADGPNDAIEARFVNEAKTKRNPFI